MSPRSESAKRYQRDWHRRAYAGNPEKFKKRAQSRRVLKGVEINAQRRKRWAARRAEKQAAAWKVYQQNPPDSHLPVGEQLRLWLDAKGWTVRQLAREVRVSARSVHDWIGGKHPPVGRKRRGLYDVTGLECFFAKRREKLPPAANVRAADVMKDLVVRCGLNPSEVCNIQISQVTDRGIQISNKRLIQFGTGWERLDRAALEEWIVLARPERFLFFLRKPVDRSRPADSLWVLRALRSLGVRSRRSQTTRAWHFAGDFSRLGASRRFLTHLRRDHGLSKTGSHEALERLRRQKVLLGESGGWSAPADPGTAYLAFYPMKKKARRGRPTTKAAIFNAARKLRKQHLPWTGIAQQLTPKEFAEDPRRAAEAIRQGVRALRR